MRVVAVGNGRVLDKVGGLGNRRDAKVPKVNVNKVERGNKPMPDRLLSDIKACVFDAYGTLFDFASAARACVDVPDEAVERLTTLWRDKQLQYTWLG
jgi:hypothetical protein